MAETYTQARIRVNQEGASEVIEALFRYEAWLLDIRDALTNKDDRKTMNRRLSAVRRVQAEVERVLEEQGWSQEDQDGEPQRSDT